MVSPITQNAAERQDTDIRNIRTGPLTELAAFESMLTGALQALPLNVSAFPLRSMATQKVADAHDTACRWVPGSMAVGLLQEVPLKVTTFGP